MNLIFQVRLRLIIDLTNTDRFYDKIEVEQAGIHHVKMQCKGFVKPYWHCVYCFVYALDITGGLVPYLLVNEKRIAAWSALYNLEQERSHMGFLSLSQKI